MQKSEKSLEPFLRKLRYQPTNQPTNQPIITNNTDLLGPPWRRSKKVERIRNYLLKCIFYLFPGITNITDFCCRC